VTSSHTKKKDNHTKSAIYPTPLRHIQYIHRKYAPVPINAINLKPAEKLSEFSSKKYYFSLKIRFYQIFQSKVLPKPFIVNLRRLSPHIIATTFVIFTIFAVSKDWAFILESPVQ